MLNKCLSIGYVFMNQNLKSLNRNGGKKKTTIKNTYEPSCNTKAKKTFISIHCRSHNPNTVALFGPSAGNLLNSYLKSIIKIK